jgi:hypothetical protein
MATEASAAQSARAPAKRRTQSRQARVQSGKNYPMQAALQSPLIRAGIPPQAVPAVAGATAVGVAALWPFLLKTLLALLKSSLGSFLKIRAKKNKKVDSEAREIHLLGFRLRPAEMAALLLGGGVHGLAVCYTLKGWKLDLPFVLSEESLVLIFYYARSLLRFFYERHFGLITQFRFWPGGGLLCLGSAYLGNMLPTVGYELELAKGQQATERAVWLKVWLLALALALGFVCFAANLLHPLKVLQSGRLICSSVALAEILPISLMPGLRIYKWRKGMWVLLFLLAVPSYFLINYVF